MSDGNYQQSLESAQETLTLAESYSDEDIPNRPELLAQLHGKLGAAHLQIGNTEQALEHHKDALELVNSQ